MPQRVTTSSIRPLPADDLRLIDAVFVGVVPAVDLQVAVLLLGVSPDFLEHGRAIDHIDRQTESIDLIVDGQLHWSVDVALFLVSAYVHVGVVRAAIRESVNQPWIAMEIEYNRL